MEFPVYFNYKCRKCGSIVSVEVNTKEEYAYRINQKGVYSSNKSEFHPDCSEMVEQEEHIFFDLVSWSEEPIGNIAKTKRQVEEDFNAGDDRKV